VNPKWEDIDTCPILNFQKVEETGDSRHLYIKYDKNADNLDAHFQKLTGQVIDAFGLTEIGMLIFHKTKELTKLNGKWIVTEDEALLTDIEIAERKLERLIKKATSGTEKDLKKLHATNHRVLSGWSKRDSRELSVFEYYNDLKDYNSEQTRMRDARTDK